MNDRSRRIPTEGDKTSKVLKRETQVSPTRFEILMREAPMDAEMGDTGDANTDDEIIFSQ